MREYFGYTYACVPYVCPVPVRPEEGMNPLELKLQMVVSHHVGARNGIPDPL